MSQRRPRTKDPPPGGFSRKRPSGFVAPQSQIHQGYSPSSRLPAFSPKTAPLVVSKQALSDPPGRKKFCNFFTAGVFLSCPLNGAHGAKQRPLPASPGGI